MAGGRHSKSCCCCCFQTTNGSPPPKTHLHHLHPYRCTSSNGRREGSCILGFGRSPPSLPPVCVGIPGEGVGGGRHILIGEGCWSSPLLLFCVSARRDRRRGREGEEFFWFDCFPFLPPLLRWRYQSTRPTDSPPFFPLTHTDNFSAAAAAAYATAYSCRTDEAAVSIPPMESSTSIGTILPFFPRGSRYTYYQRAIGLHFS